MLLACSARRRIMTERASMPCIELLVFEDRERRLGVRLSTGDKKPQRMILTEIEAAQLMFWLGTVTRRVIQVQASFDVDLLRDKL